MSIVFGGFEGCDSYDSVTGVIERAPRWNDETPSSVVADFVGMVSTPNSGMLGLNWDKRGNGKFTKLMTNEYDAYEVSWDTLRWVPKFATRATLDEVVDALKELGVKVWVK